MKKFAYLLIVVLIVAMLPTSCGKDGLPGLAFIAHDWYGLPFYYNDDNADTPFTIFQGTDYETDAGTYNFDYQAWDGSVWVGWYEITINPGEEGGLIEDGADGLDRYYTLWLLSSGADLDVYNAQAHEEEMQRVEDAGIDLSKSLEVKNRINRSDLVLDDEIIVKESTKGNVTLHLEYRRAYVK